MTITASKPGTSAAIPSRGPGALNKAIAVLVMLVGAGLIVITLVSNLFAVGPAFENLIVDFRPALTQSSIDTARADIASLSGRRQRPLWGAVVAEWSPEFKEHSAGPVQGRP